MAQLTTLLKKLSEVDESLHQFYSPVDANDEAAGFTLQLDNKQNKTGINEFRDANVLLRKQVEGFEGKLEALSGLQGKFDALSATMNNAEDKANIEKGDVDAVVARQVAAAGVSAQSKYDALETSFVSVQRERDSLKTVVGHTRVRDAMLGAFTAGKARMKDGAEVDLLSRATGVWSIDSETNLLVAKNPETREPLYGDEGKPLGMAEWATKTTASAPYFFEPAQGGGAGGNRSNEGSKRRDLGGAKEIDVHDGNSLVNNLDDIIAGKIKPVMS